jgi:hypothetical protein
MMDTELLSSIVVYYILSVIGMYQIQKAHDDNSCRCFGLAIFWPVWIPLLGFMGFIRFGE